MYAKKDNNKKRRGDAHSPRANGGYSRGGQKKTSPRGPREEKEKNEEFQNGAVPGRNAVRELLKSGKAIDKIFVRRGDREGSITVLVAEAISRKIPVIEAEKEKLDALCGYEQHQGIVALASEKEYCDIDDILAIAEERGEKPLIIIADGVSDPHNLGAIIRCAEGAGAHGVIIPKRRAAGATPAVAKASAGALEHMAVAKCANISDTIRKLKDRGLWIFAAEADGTDYTKTDLDIPAAIIVGSEEYGISEIVKKNSDFIVSIPMLGKVNSLNVSTAAAVLLYEAVRQRTSKI
ncbi:MAG: 23S rRNA (guanosine(2251)-2'-O)-methyltransferase RlmB [Clostridia bacterium]|nr:23S rRNA (guanosine(2251)-2'-O)-methyltransferase RlmB [Clostridia bacterium]